MFICHECNTVTPETEVRTFDDLKFCIDCFRHSYFTCARCDTLGHRGGENFIESENISICDDCFCGNYLICRECGESTRVSRMRGDICRDCASDEPTTYEPSYSEKQANRATIREAKESFSLFGVELELNTQGAKLTQLPAWSCVRDGSLSNGLEYVSRVFPANETGYVELAKCVSLLKKNGHKPDKSCGFHLHFNVVPKDAKSIKFLKSLLIAYLSLEPHIYAMLPNSRRTNTYCRRLDCDLLSHYRLELAAPKSGKKHAEYMEAWDNFCRGTELTNLVEKIPHGHYFENAFYAGQSSYKKDHYYSKRYYGLNLHSIFYRGSIELRYHGGTCDKHKVVNWVKFHKAIMDFIQAYKGNYLAMRELGKKEFLASVLGPELTEYMTERVAKFENDEQTEAVEA